MSKKSRQYASVIAVVSLLGLGGTALLLHDRNSQGTISNDLYWKKIAQVENAGGVQDQPSIDDLVKLADRINTDTSVLPENATRIKRIQRQLQQNSSPRPQTLNDQNQSNVQDILSPAVAAAAVPTQPAARQVEQPVVRSPQPGDSDYTGWDEAKRKYYMDGVPITGEATIDDKKYFFDDDGIVYTGWRTIYYTDKDGQQASGDVYYKDGLQCFGRTKVGDNYYHLDEQTGIKDTSLWVEDRFYDSDGKEATGRAYIDGNIYYFYEDGKLAVGFHDETWNGHTIRCYSNDDIEKDGYGVKQYGIQKIKGKTYKFDDITGGLYDGTWNGKQYLDKDGKPVSGKQVIAGRDLLFDENGYVVNGWYKDKDGSLFYCDEDGTQYFGLWEIDEKTYYFDPKTGASIGAGWHDAKDIGSDEGGKVYFIPQSGDKGPYMAEGRVDIEGKPYYFDPETGILQKNLRDPYYTDEEGVIQFGEQTVDGKTVYYDPQTGERVSGWHTEDGKTYYYDENGKVKGKLTLDGVEYSFDPETGEMVSRGLVGDYFINDDGSLFTGTKDVDGKTYYFDPLSEPKGKMAKGLITIPARYNNGKSKTMYFDPDGNMITGAVQIDGETYYFDKEEGRVSNKIVEDGGKKYFFQENGVLFKDGTRLTRDKKKKVTSDENGVVTKIEAMGIDNPLLPAGGGIEWHPHTDYPTHPGNPFSRPWCTWWAYNRFYEIYGYSPGIHGNGCTNASELLAAHPDKFMRSSEPVAGGMFSVPPGVLGGTASSAGHVGIIEKVEDGYVYTSEGGFSMSGSEADMGVAYCQYTIESFNAKYPGAIFAVPIE